MDLADLGHLDERETAVPGEQAQEPAHLARRVESGPTCSIGGGRGAIDADEEEDEDRQQQRQREQQGPAGDLVRANKMHPAAAARSGPDRGGRR